MRGTVGFNTNGALNALAASFGADRGGNTSRQQRKHSLLSGLGRNRVNSAFKKLDGNPAQSQDKARNYNASPHMGNHNEVDLRRDSGFFEALSGLPGYNNRKDT